MSTLTRGMENKPTIKINLKPDTLNLENQKFQHKRLTQPLFLNSVPKCGTHLLKNIIRMFVPLDQQYQAEFIQLRNLKENWGALSDDRNFLSYGHLLFDDRSAVATGLVRHILLVRDPYDWVLSRARFFVSEEFQGFDLLKKGILKPEAILNMMILGIMERAEPLAALFSYNAVGWLPTAHLVRYEELVRAIKNLESDEAEAYFRGLLDACGIDLPDDWRERVQIGSDRKQSGTASENLSGINVEFPKELPDIQKKMVDMVAPGLREILGYK